MRRPLALAGFTLLFTNLLCMVLSISAAFILCGIALALLIVILVIQNKNNSHLKQSLRGCCFFCFCGCLSFILLFQMQIKPVERLQGVTQYTQFTVLEEAGTYDERNYYVVCAKGLYPDEEKECKFRLSMESPYTVSVGDVSSAMVTFSQANTGNLWSQNIPLTAVLAQDASPTKMGEEKGFSYIAHTARLWVGRSFVTFGNSDTLSLVQGICLGNADGMSKGLQQDFYSCGLGHLAAVSGLHTSQIAGVFIGLFLLVIQRKRWVKLCSLGFVWAFVLLTGASFSSLRAAVMFTCFAIANCFFRKPDSLNTLGLAITAILLCDPFAVGNIGFLASVSACVGLILLTSPLEQKLLSLFPIRWQTCKPFVWVIKAFAVTLAATVATVPCNFLGFYNLALVAPLANLICVPLATFILILGLLGALLCPIPFLSIVGKIFIWLAHGIASLIAETASLLGRIPYHNLIQGTPIAFLVFCLCALGMAWLFTKGKHYKPGVKTAIVLLLCLGTLFSCLLPGVPPSQVEVCLLSNPYDCDMVVTSGTTTVYIGCSLTQELDRYLSSRGTNNIDLWVLPRRGGYTSEILSLTTNFAIDKIATPATKYPTFAYSSHQTPPPVTYAATVTVENITVTALNDYRSFVVATPYGTVSFADTQTVTQPTADFSFISRKAFSGKTHQLQEGENLYPLSQTTAIRLSKTGYKLYQPKFSF